jgi:hypothetical protein
MGAGNVKVGAGNVKVGAGNVKVGAGNIQTGGAGSQVAEVENSHHLPVLIIIIHSGYGVWTSDP